MNAMDEGTVVAKAAAVLATVAVAIVAVAAVEGTQVEVTSVTAKVAYGQNAQPKNPFRNKGRDINNNNKKKNANVNGGGAARDKEGVECCICH